MTDVKKEAVNHPAHYNQGKVECIDAMEAATTGLEGIEAVDTASVIKYMWRWKFKNGAEDLKKAQWYLEHLLKHINKQQNIEAQSGRMPVQVTTSPSKK